MKKLLYTFIFLCIFSPSIAQDGIGYYYDYNDNFYAFDKGRDVPLESNRVDSIRVGNTYLAYIDQRSDLRFYFDGSTTTIEESVPNIMVPTANALVYRMQQRLMICENGVKKQLAAWVDNFYAGDSIVTWQDLPSLNIMAYQNGEIRMIEKAVSTNVINNGKAGKNIFAYSDLNNNFKIYFDGQIYDTQVSNIRNYKCGLNTVAYLDRFNNTFNIFYNGNITTMPGPLPKSYDVADNMVSYIDNSGNFIMFYDGSFAKLESDQPTTYTTKDNLIEYFYDPQLKAVFEGRTYDLEKFMTNQNILLGPNSVLYLDSYNHPKYFYKGKTIDSFLTEPIKEMHLNRDLPVFKYGNNTTGFYYNGKMYEYESSKTN